MVSLTGVHMSALLAEVLVALIVSGYAGGVWALRRLAERI